MLDPLSTAIITLICYATFVSTIDLLIQRNTLNAGRLHKSHYILKCFIVFGLGVQACCLFILRLYDSSYCYWTTKIINTGWHIEFLAAETLWLLQSYHINVRNHTLKKIQMVIAIRFLFIRGLFAIFDIILSDGDPNHPLFNCGYVQDPRTGAYYALDGAVSLYTSGLSLYFLFQAHKGIKTTSSIAPGQSNIDNQGKSNALTIVESRKVTAVKDIPKERMYIIIANNNAVRSIVISTLMTFTTFLAYSDVAGAALEYLFLVDPLMICVMCLYETNIVNTINQLIS